MTTPVDLMRAHAGLDVDLEAAGGGGVRARIRRLRSEGAIVLRPTRETLPRWADRWDIPPREAVSVRVVAGAAGPLGGDHWRLDVRVGEGATLLLGSVAATLVLPGTHGDESLSEVNVSVAAGGTLVWRPGVQIAASRCRHTTVARIDLADGARLYAREEFMLGRHGEMPGDFRQRLRVTHRDVAIFDQELSVGPDAPGWQSAAITGGRQALGSVVVVDSAPNAMDPFGRATLVDCPDTAVLQLSEHAALISSLAADAIDLRVRLDRAFAPFTLGRSARDVYGAGRSP
ncbi:urease accessory protein UreD [Cryobacterium sp. N22]|uniref:urease accessory protein UreD n=1 Tax=Cryobacterium sp. N22 TaxID=2048290 RepID=UPI0011B0EF6B|nr:urease accessory protein UreD [Cryobacterium sp. N22]